MSVNGSAPRLASAVLLALFGTAFAARSAHAASSNPWDGDAHPSFMFYAWLPGVSLDTRYKLPDASGGEVVNKSDGNILDNLSGAFMMAGDVRVGDWGFYGDLAWVKFDDQDGKIRDFNGEHITADLKSTWNIKGGVVTLGGLYSIAHGSFGYTDLVFGGRYLWVKGNLKWDFNATGNGGLIDISNSGHLSNNAHSSDAIIGLRGNWILGGGNWYIPYYFDVGTGNSEWTTSATVGIAYRYDWGNIGLVWRDLRYKQGNDDFLRKFDLSGPSFNIGWQF
jgi:hypothetical protein